MGKFSYTFISRYPLDTYEDVINIYEWLSHCFKYVFFDISDLKLSSSFSFAANQIDYECSSIDEFEENAFGLNIQPETLFVCAKTGNDHFSEILAHFWLRKSPKDKELKIVLSSDIKKYLISLKDALAMEQNVLITALDRKYKSDKAKMQLIDSTETQYYVSKPQREHKEPWYTQLFGEIVIPIVVTILAALIVWKLGIN